MKTSTTEVKKEHLASVCCRGGFTKMVITLPEYLKKFRNGEPSRFGQSYGYWIPLQVCGSCGKECEVEYIKPE